MDGDQIARHCARYADQKKAEDIVILDVRGISPITDYFVICTASSAPHLRAVKDEVAEKMKEKHGLSTRYADENYESQWLILDFGDVMLHIFHQDKRDFYALEDLWGDAPTMKWEA